MLGDTGANLLGAVLGLAVVLETSRPVRTVVLIALVALNLASERVSFSTVIDRHPRPAPARPPRPPPDLTARARRAAAVGASTSVPSPTGSGRSGDPRRACVAGDIDDHGLEPRSAVSRVAVGLEVDATDVAVVGDLVAGRGEAVGEVVEGAPARRAADDDRAHVVLGGDGGERCGREVTGLDAEHGRVDEVGRRAASGAPHDARVVADRQRAVRQRLAAARRPRSALPVKPVGRSIGQACTTW